MTASKRLMRALIVSEEALFRESLCAWLNQQASILAHAAGKAAAANALTASPPEILLLDLEPNRFAADADFTRKARSGGFRGKIIVLTQGLSETHLVQLFEAGVDGTFNKRHSAASLVGRIMGALEGQAGVEDAVTLFETRSLPAPRRVMTGREAEVLQGVVALLSNKEIAWRLSVSESAVKAVIQQLFQKIGVHSRAGLVRWAVQSENSGR